MALRLFGETAALRDFDPAYARFGSKADISPCPRDVRFTPKSGHWFSVSECPLCAKSRHSALRQKPPLFDHLVGAGEQRWRHFEVERLGGSQVDDEIEFGRLLY